MKSTKPFLARRSFLGACGASLAVAPLMPLLAQSQESGPPLRLILFYQPHGMRLGIPNHIGHQAGGGESRPI
jgi:hypothetical protein